MADATAAKKPTDSDWKALNTIVKKANAGDRKALELLRRFLDENPRVWQHLGDLARTAEHAWVQMISNGDKLAAESIHRQLNKLKEDLVGEAPSAVEGMLGDAVMSSWLEVKYLESVSADSPGQTLGQSSMLLKRLESAQKRHLNSIKQIVQVRKLLPKDAPGPELRLFEPTPTGTG